MKRIRTTVITTVLLAFGMFALGATPTAEKQYATIQQEDLTTTSLQDVMSAYDTLNTAIATEAQDARQQMYSARAKGDADAYYAALDTLRTLGTYTMSQETSDTLLQEILALDDAQKAEDAAWLFKNSPYYHPMMTLNLAAKGDSFNYNFTQSIQQEPASDVTLPDASQLRINSSQVGILAGWGLTADEVTYKPGETIPMSYTDQTLYAIYQEGVQFTDSLNGTSVVQSLDNVQVPTPVANDSSTIFAGWYDRSTRTLITDPTTYTVQGKGASFEALWKSLSIDNVTVLYYDASKLPTNTQLGIGFTYANAGTVGLNGLKATLSTDSEYVKMLKDTLNLGSIGAGLQSTNNSPWATSEKQDISGEANTFRFLVSSDAPSGTTIPFTVTLTNDKGDQWTQTFECITR